VKSLKSYVLDTSVALAYIIENAPGRDRVVEIFNAAKEGRVKLYTALPRAKRSTVCSAQNI
jgi:predicted nucleic acid-binding protein